MSSTFENFPSSHQSTIVGADEWISRRTGVIIATQTLVKMVKMKMLIRHKSMEQQEHPFEVPVEAKRRAA